MDVANVDAVIRSRESISQEADGLNLPLEFLLARPPSWRCYQQMQCT